MLTEQEINHQIATKINGWTHLEGIYYQNADGAICYLADYCNSIQHALDIARTQVIGLVPSDIGWMAYSVVNETITNSDASPGKAICLTALAMLDPLT